MASPVKELAEARRRHLGIEQPEQAREGIVARRAALEIQELAEQRLPIPRKIGKIHAAFRAADDRCQGNRQHIQ